MATTGSLEECCFLRCLSVDTGTVRCQRATGHAANAEPKLIQNIFLSEACAQTRRAERRFQLIKLQPVPLVEERETVSHYVQAFTEDYAH